MVAMMILILTAAAAKSRIQEIRVARFGVAVAS